MFLLIAALYWLGFGLRRASRRAPLAAGSALPCLLLALAPPAFMLLGMIWRDVLFADVWLFAAALAYAAAARARGDRAGRRRHWRWSLVAFGVLLRPNAIFAAPLLAAYVIWPARFALEAHRVSCSCRRSPPGYALMQLTYYAVLDVKREHPLHSLFVFDLGGITHFTGENQFPVAWSAARDRAAHHANATTRTAGTTTGTSQPCRFVMQRLERKDDKVFGTPRLIEAWRARGAGASPRLSAAPRRPSPGIPRPRSNLTLELLTPTTRPRRRCATPPFQALVALQTRSSRRRCSALGFWLALAMLVGAFAWPCAPRLRARSRSASTGSAIVYVLTFLPFGVAADFRYGYWCVLASLAGAVACSRRAVPLLTRLPLLHELLVFQQPRKARRRLPRPCGRAAPRRARPSRRWRRR